MDKISKDKIVSATPETSVTLNHRRVTTPKIKRLIYTNFLFRTAKLYLMRADKPLWRMIYDNSHSLE
jgi:hypothetical protein